MKTVFLIYTLFFATNLFAGTLIDLGNRFVKSAVSGDFGTVEKTLLPESEQKDAMLAAMKGAAGAVESGELTITHIDRELIIGDLGATLIKIQTKSGDVDYDPILYAREDESWYIVPWADEKGLRAFAAGRSQDEQIHLKLFNEWAHLLEKQLESKAEQDGADQPATAPESKSEGSEEPKPESEGRSQ